MKAVRKPHKGIWGLFVVVALAAGAWLLPTVSVSATVTSTPSDGRATFHGGNATTCADAGFPGDVFLGSGDNPASGTTNADAFFSGTVSDHTGGGQQLNVSVVAPGGVIDAIVVKGGDAYNQYDSIVSDMIAPLNGGGQVPAISHWFLCYHTQESGTGSLKITKTVLPFTVGGTPLTPIPTSFTAHVVCNDGTDKSVTFDPATPATVTGIVEGSVCVVTETTVLPAGSGTPVYALTTASTTGVTIVKDTVVTVGITNDFRTISVSPEVVAVVVQPTFTG
jgi:Domain of unknown function (DUF5979)